MISLVSPRASLTPAALAAPGGFAWWYLDLVDEAGNGLVFIWSFGLPFLPGMRGTRVPPATRPALVLAGYTAGRPSFYLFEEMDPAEVEGAAADGPWRFGDTIVRLVREGGGVRVEVEVDLGVPGSSARLRGTISAAGPLRGEVAGAPVGAGTPGGVGTHAWTPLLAAAEGRADLRGAWDLRLRGRVYVDHNAGTSPLHTLGIRRWSWGRLAFPGRELIWYHLVPQGPGPARSLVAAIGAGGATTLAEGPVELSSPSWSVPGFSWPRRVTFADPEGCPVEVDVPAPVDRSPFYQRFLVSGTRDGARARGVAELVVPGRLDAAWMRPFVRMRVRSPGRRPSWLLPWFAGPVAGRWARLLGLGTPRLPAPPEGAA